jgi:hypothetical protein
MSKGNLDDIKTANRYFRYECAGAMSNAGGQSLDDKKTLRFRLPPLSALGFSTNYNQCLCKIRRVMAGDGGWYNPVWADGSAINNHDLLPAGLLIQTNIPCRNFGAVRVENNIIGQGSLDQRFGVTIIPKFVDGVILGNNTTWNEEIATGFTSHGAKKQLCLVAGATAGAGAAADVGGGNRVERGNGYYSYEDKSSIFDTGMLCGVPFGGVLEISFKDSFSDVKLGLCDYSDTTTFIGGYNITLEFLMLENPKV